MNDDEYKVAEHLPSSIDAEPITSLAQVADVELGKINTDLLLIYPAIDSLNEQLIDYLAVQMHVDEYDDTENLDVKRQQVKQSFLLHRLKGTKYAVQKAVSTVYQSAKVEEWPEYSGEPYHFRVTGITAPMNETKTINKLVRLINAYKNTRSWLDYVQFNRLYRQTFLFGGNVNLVRKTTITFDLKQKIITQKDIHVLVGVGIYKEVTINGQLE
ncbi:phage tail protein I [Megasphaera elsdenii]|uniref:phage tail protein I n=1 Tax=Megasphaera TaxID=906 RepID=UPI002E77A1EF|nr:phage tail protein I [Megasphaera elsdenii]MEE0404147.1 phage tail protein I [Megasphaera elsdenii]